MEKNWRDQSVQVLPGHDSFAQLDPPLRKARIEGLYRVAGNVRKRQASAPGSLVGALAHIELGVPYADFLVGHPVFVVQEVLAVVVHRGRGGVLGSSLLAVATPTPSVSAPTKGGHHRHRSLGQHRPSATVLS